jgi:hypothetical protein
MANKLYEAIYNLPKMPQFRRDDPQEMCFNQEKDPRLLDKQYLPFNNSAPEKNEGKSGRSNLKRHRIQLSVKVLRLIR